MHLHHCRLQVLPRGAIRRSCKSPLQVPGAGGGQRAQLRPLRETHAAASAFFDRRSVPTADSLCRRAASTAATARWRSAAAAAATARPMAQVEGKGVAGSLSMAAWTPGGPHAVC